MNHPTHPFDWKILDSHYAIHERWLKVRQDRCQMPDGREVDPYYVIEYPDWINVLALDKNQHVILTRQYRHGIGATVLELPSGSVDKGEPPIDTARRELLEETGYHFDNIIQTSVVSPNPGNHANLVYSFLAIGGEKIKEPSFDETEEIETVIISLNDFKKLLADNGLVQAMHVSAAYYGLKMLEGGKI